MDLLKMVENYKKVNEEARKANNEIMSTLRELFVDLPFEIKQVGIEETIGMFDEEKILNKVYYPVLSVPEGYNKEQEEYEKIYGNGMNHKYILTSEAGPQIAVLEHTYYIRYLRTTRKGTIEFPFSIISSEISYEVTILGETCEFTRTFKHEDMLAIISGKEVGKAISSFPICRDHSYTKAEIEYEKFLTAIGITEIEIPLSKIVKSKCKEIMLNSFIKARIEILFTEKANYTWFANEYWEASIQGLPYTKVTVKMNLYAGGVNITYKELVWYEVKDKKYKKGITFQEAIELIKE